MLPKKLWRRKNLVLFRYQPSKIECDYIWIMLKKLFCGIDQKNGFEEKLHESDGQAVHFSDLQFQKCRDINECLLPDEQDMLYKERQIGKAQNLPKERMLTVTTSNSTVNIKIPENHQSPQAAPSCCLTNPAVNQSVRPRITFNSLPSSHEPLPSMFPSQFPVQTSCKMQEFPKLEISSVKPMRVDIREEGIIYLQSRFGRQSVAFQNVPSEEYCRLLVENAELKRIVREEYLPMKESYERLTQNQGKRDQLISKLEWKVKELAKQIRECRKANF